MLFILRSMFAPLLALVVFVFGAGYFMTYSTLYYKACGGADQQLGFLQAAYYAGMLIASTISYAVISRWGYTKSFLVACLLGVLSVIFMGAYCNLLVWSAMRFLNGFSIAIIYVVVESWLLALGTSKTQGQIIAIYMVALYITHSLSQYLLDIPFEDLEIPFDTQWLPFLVTAAVMLLALLPLIRVQTPISKVESVTLGGNLKSLMRMAPFGLLAGMFAGLILGSLYCFAPSFALEHGIKVSQLMSLTIAGGVALQWPVGHLADRVNRKLFLIGTSALLAIFCLAIVIWPEMNAVVLVLSFLLGGAAFTLYPQSIVTVVNQAQGVSLTAITAIQSIAYSIGSIVGPLLAPFFTDYWGPVGLYVFITIAALLQCVIGLCSFAFSRRSSTSIVSP